MDGFYCTYILNLNKADFKTHCENKVIKILKRKVEEIIHMVKT